MSDSWTDQDDIQFQLYADSPQRHWKNMTYEERIESLKQIRDQIADTNHWRSE